MGSLAMILLLILSSLTSLLAQSPLALDALLQDFAFRAFVRPKTGTVYKALPPSNLTDVKLYTLRLKNGSLRSRGVAAYREFRIPVGIMVKPYVERIVLVYQNLGNVSSEYYPLSGYTYLSPVLGLLAYDAANLSAKNLPEIKISSSLDPISINFSQIASIPRDSNPKCVFFDLALSHTFSTMGAGNLCNTTQQGHFAVVMENMKKKKKKDTGKVWMIVGVVIGGVLVLCLLGMSLLCVWKLRNKRKIEKMEKEAEYGEVLRMTAVGDTRAPSAIPTRTHPTLENEYVP